MDDLSFRSLAWPALSAALTRLSPLLAPRLFHLRVVDGTVQFRVWMPERFDRSFRPQSSIEPGVASLREVLPLLVDDETAPDHSIDDLAGLLDRISSQLAYYFAVMSDDPPTKALILRVRRAGLADAWGLDDQSLTKAQDIEIEGRPTLFDALIHRGLHLVDQEWRLEEAIRTLRMTGADSPLQRLAITTTPTELLRRSAALALERALRETNVRRVGRPYATLDGYLFQRVEEVSKKNYEGRGTTGVIRIGALVPTVKFAQPVPLSPDQVGAVRKALEMSNARANCLVVSTDGRQLEGLLDAKRAAGPFLDVRFEGAHRWSCALHGKALFKVVHGVPMPSKPVLRRSTFRHWVRHVFGRQARVDHRGMWAPVRKALKAAHGALVIFCTDPAVLGLPMRQSFAFESPCAPSPRLLSGLFEIDGAAIFDLTGACHGAGVILDGISVEDAGDIPERRERGARFTSTVRFLAGHRGKAGAIVVSEDGMVDLLPPPPNLEPSPREERARVERLLDMSPDMRRISAMFDSSDDE